MATIAIQQDGVIEGGKCYPIQTFRNLTGMGHAAIREARKKGLLVRAMTFVIKRMPWPPNPHRTIFSVFMADP